MFKPLRTMWLFPYILKAFLIETATSSLTRGCCSCRWPVAADSDENSFMAVRVRTDDIGGGCGGDGGGGRVNDVNNGRRKQIYWNTWRDRDYSIGVWLSKIVVHTVGNAHTSKRDVTDAISKSRPSIRWRWTGLDVLSTKKIIIFLTVLVDFEGHYRKNVTNVISWHAKKFLIGRGVNLITLCKCFFTVYCYHISMYRYSKILQVEIIRVCNRNVIVDNRMIFTKSKIASLVPLLTTQYIFKCKKKLGKLWVKMVKCAVNETF